MNQETTSKKYISPSQLGMYEKCGVQYYRRYVKGERLPPGIAFVKGTGIHKGARENFRQKKDTHRDLPKTDIVDISVAEFEKIASKGILLNAEEERIGYGKVVGTAKDRVVKLAGLFSDVIAPKYQPVYVEESYRLVVDTSQYDLLAIMDLADDQDDVVDFKVTGKKRPQKDVDNNEQLTFYTLVYKALTGRLPRRVKLQNLVDTKKLTHQVLESERTMADLQILINRVNQMIRGIEANIFNPARLDAWWCDARYCGYYRTCEYTKKGERSYGEGTVVE